MTLISPPRKIQKEIFTKLLTKNQHLTYLQRRPRLALILELNAGAAIFVPAYSSRIIDCRTQSKKNNLYTISVSYNIKRQKRKTKKSFYVVGEKKKLQ